MAVVFGEKPDENGWIRVTMIQHKMDSHENGYSVNNDDIPSYPVKKRGIGWVQYYHPQKDEWEFRPMEVPYTEAESMLEIAEAIRELTQVLKEK